MRKHSDDEIIKAVKDSFTYADVCRKLNMLPAGGSYNVVKRYIKELNINIDHFTNRSSNINNRLNRYNEKDVFHYLKKDSYIKTESLKWKLIKSGLKKYICECCGLTKWNGKQIKLQLHHINGDNTDNRLENLQLLCPNCHSLTDTYCGNNIKNKNINIRYCKGCGKVISDKLLVCDDCYEKLIKGDVESFKFWTIRKGVCDVCGNETSSPKIHICDDCLKNQRREDFLNRIPTKETLKDLIFKFPFTQIGRMYKVSDNTIKKWCKFYNLPHRKKDILKR